MPRNRAAVFSFRRVTAALGVAFIAGVSAFAGTACEKTGEIKVVRVDPSTGTTMGGDQVTIIGSGFEPGKTQAEVRFGRKRAESVVIASSDKINVSTPNGDRGPVDVTITFNDGRAFSIPNGFTFVQPEDPNKVREAYLKQNQ